MTFPIGTEFTTRGKPSQRHTVVDVYRTYNSAGDLVKTRYVTIHEFCGQTVKDFDVVATTICRALNTPEPE